MKTTYFVLLALVTAAMASSAYAGSDLLIELPVYQANDMTTTAASGSLQGLSSVSIALTQLGAQASPSGMRLEVDGQTLFLPIQQAVTDSCGFVTYTAQVSQMDMKTDMEMDPQVTYTVRLRDLTGRYATSHLMLCFVDGLKGWRAQVSETLQSAGHDLQSLGSMELEGTPVIP